MQNGNYYMTKQETDVFFKKDEDNYVNNLSQIDLYARNVRSSNEYIQNLENISSSFTDNEIHILNKITVIADKLLKTIKITDINYINYINLNDIANIKWIFAKTIVNDKIIKSTLSFSLERFSH
jgi:hypothetical protein